MRKAMGIELKKITWDNYKDFLDLEVEESQKKYVASPQFGITEAYLNQIQGCCTTAVSYTHLDVYKRQANIWY